MKSIEWQTESYLMAVRVRAKQWYWTYKIALDDVTRLLTSNLIIGSGKVISNSEGDSIIDFYNLHNFIGDSQTNKKSSPLKRDIDVLFLSKDYDTDVLNGPMVSLSRLKTPFIFLESQFSKTNTFFLNIKNSDTGFVKFINYRGDLVSTNYSFSEFIKYKKIITHFNDFILLKHPSNHYNSSVNGRSSSRLFIYSNGSSLKPALLADYLPVISPISHRTIDSLFSKNTPNSSSLETKTSLWSKKDKSIYFFSLEKNPNFSNNSPLVRFVDLVHNKEKFRRYYLTIKQTRGFASSQHTLNGEKYNTNEFKSMHLTDTPLKIANSKENSHTLLSNQRLLEVDNLLVLPTHTGLTIITNSYDVVHSWFVPGLGLKMDCVPGRSTHHSLYVRTPGFYYGQCAEVCGRLHHHMPVRVCFLPVEHFFV